MENEGKQEEKEQIIDCEFCDGFISLGFYMDSGDVVYCEECGTEYLIASLNPLHLQPIEEDKEDDEEDEEDEEDEDGFDIISGYDDDYNDGRYD
ncbi:MAG: hypothetical protein K9K37_04115 [Desulfocapsa sp.]|nr:hypothetical protein [Desulfocapsa sp.]